ncbi:31c57e93-a648-4d04-93ce-454ec08452f1 [Thermothielavioides terrestris]|uniref:31c57e93-a648-4d04-93ce-454ec08452f1 n=1 Tax=Thermothielavioides terrestris TaxID=2587410 RepID=A0A3S4AUA6_9PEZI|nr:31c57e93-a648-4d04-93ce-454ec08452f1 [Thermothielavioides terrestris]
MPHASQPDPMFGLLFQDAPHDHLLVRFFGSGASCQTSLVCPVGGGPVRVRKALKSTAIATGSLNESAEVQFDRDVAVARQLHARAAATGYRLLVPKLLGEYPPLPLQPQRGQQRRGSSHPPTAPRSSYWTLCNGGTLFGLDMACVRAGVSLPRGLVLHFLQQVLETLEFMHSDPVAPVFHRDLHPENALLHFAPGRLIPDLYIIDFGRAGTRAAPTAAAAAAATTEDDDDDNDRQRRCCCTRARCDCKAWDVSRLLHDDLLSLLRCPDHPHPRPDIDTGSDSDSDTDTDTAAAPCSLCRACRMLQAADRAYWAIVAEDEAAAAAGGHGRGRAQQHRQRRLAVPSLQPIIGFLRREAAQELAAVATAAEFADFRRRVLVPVRKAALALEAAAPRVAATAGELVAACEGVPGPWSVVALDVGADGCAVDKPRVVPAGPRSGEEEL